MSETNNIEEVDSRENLECTNDQNDFFYNELTLQEFRMFAETAGIHNGSDIDNLTDYIKNAGSILEIGAGYGRVIEFIRSLNTDSHITAIERNKKYYQYLISCYEGSVELFNTDIKQYKFNKSYSLILWLWAGFTEFSKSEQASLLQHLSHGLADDGKIVIDLIAHDADESNASNAGGNNFVISSASSILTNKLFFPDPKMMQCYSTAASLKIINTISYKTATNRKREIYILSK